MTQGIFLERGRMGCAQEDDGCDRINEEFVMVQLFVGDT